MNHSIITQICSTKYIVQCYVEIRYSTSTSSSSDRCIY